MKLEDLSDASVSKLCNNALSQDGIEVDEGDLVFLLNEQVHKAMHSLKKNASRLYNAALNLKNSLSSVALSHQIEKAQELPLLDAMDVLVQNKLEKALSPIQESASQVISLLCGVKNKDTETLEWMERFKSIGVQKAFFGSEVSTLLKSEESTEAEKFVLGVVLEPTDGSDGNAVKPDTDGDIYSVDEVRKAAHWYMEFGRSKGILHGPEYGGYIMDPEDHRVVILESYITPVDIPAGTFGERQKEIVKKGTWLWAIRVNDKTIWQDVVSGLLDGLSIGGVARRELL